MESSNAISTRHIQVSFIALVVSSEFLVAKVVLCQVMQENVHFYSIYIFIIALSKSPQCWKTDYFTEAIWAEIDTYHEWLLQELFTIHYCSVS